MFADTFVSILSDYGCSIDSLQTLGDQLIMFISVPETSSYGEEFAGESMIKKIESFISRLGVKNLVVKCKIRYGESWTGQSCRFMIK